MGIVKSVRSITDPSPPNLTLATLVIPQSQLLKLLARLGVKLGRLTPARRRLTDGKPTVYLTGVQHSRLRIKTVDRCKIQMQFLNK